MSIVAPDGYTVTGYAEVGVRLVHLNNGEDIIGKVWQGERVTRIERPTTPNVMSPDGKRFSIGLVPYRPFLELDAHIDIPNEQVMFVVAVQDKMAQMYVQLTSNIQIATPTEIPNLGL